MVVDTNETSMLVYVTNEAFARARNPNTYYEMAHKFANAAEEHPSLRFTVVLLPCSQSSALRSWLEQDQSRQHQLADRNSFQAA
jgi:hypothetical protein